MKKSKARMKQKIALILFTMGVLTIFFGNFVQIYSEPLMVDGNDDDNALKNLKTSYFNLTMNPIKIIGNATGVGAHNWTWANNTNWCDWDPVNNMFLIENLTIDGQNTYSCIEIANSDVLFKIKNCTLFNSNGATGEAGIKLIRTINGTIAENNISFNNIGINLYENNAFNTIEKNQISNNTAYGVLILNSTGGNILNYFYQNIFSGNAIHAYDNGTDYGMGIYNVWGANYTTFLKIGNYWDNYSGSDANDDGIGDTYHPIHGSGYAYDVMPICRDGYNGGKIFIDDSGVESHVTWEWASTLEWCDGQGIYGDPYLIQDLVINGTSSKSCIKIKNSEAIFKIQNCTLFNAPSGTDEAAILMENVINAKLMDNNCSINGRYGILLKSCNDTLITGNILDDNGGPGFSDAGLSIEISSALTDSNNITVVNNKARGNRNGVLIQGSNHIISNNIAYNNTNFGIEAGGIDHDIINNTAVDNEFGFYFLAAHNSTIENNTASENSIYGMALISSDNNVINNNNASDNVYSLSHATYATGLYLSSSNNNTVTNNIASDNSKGGIIVENGNNNTVENNTLNYNGGFGLYISESNYTWIERNDLINNTNYGMLMISSTYNDVFRNNASLNLDSGMVLFYCDWNIYMNNTVNNNSNYGFHLEDSNNNNITGNTIVGNGLRCIYAHNCYIGNSYSFNGPCTPLIENDPLPPDDPNGGSNPPIPGYDLLILIGAISVISMIYIKKQRK